MKPTTFFNSINQPLCESTLTSLAWRCLSALRSLPGAVRRKLQTLKQYVHPLLLTGLSASRVNLLNLLRNKRHVIGYVLLMVGVGQVFANQIFSDPYSEPHDVCRFLQFTAEQCIKETGWCFVSWFYFLETVRIPIALILWSVAGILFIPIKHSLSFIPFSLFNGAGWTWLFHYSIFTHSYETYHTFPYWQIAAIGLCLGFGIVMSADALVYWEQHKKRGNWQKWPAIYRSSYSQDKKNELYAMADKEYEQVNKMI